MKSSYKRLGNYIRPVDVRNSDLAITNLQGVSITKEFVPSIANIIGTDLSTYKIVRTGQFAYGPVTSRNGDKVSIALLKGDDCIISSSYSSFEIYNKDELLPEYLMLWFRRPEFDRYARFMSNGSAREVFDWDSMCDVVIPVLPIDEQYKIVNDFQVLEDRLALLQSIDDILFSNAKTYMQNAYENPLLWDGEITINEFCSVVASGGTPSRSNSEFWDNGIIPWLKNGEIKNNVIVDTEEKISEKGLSHSSAKLFPAYSIHMAMYCVSEIQIAVSCIPLTTNQAVLNFGFDSFRKASFLYYCLATFGNGITSNANGSAQQNLSKEIISAFVIKMPEINKAEFEYFEKNLNYRISIAKEMFLLKKGVELLLANLQ